MKPARWNSGLLRLIMSNNIFVYHFTKKQNITSILQNGLKHGTKYNTLDSQFRAGANYFYLTPSHDCMNYKNNNDYECLQISVDKNLCVVGNMDLISSAFYNFMMEKKNASLYNYRKLVKMFDSTAVAYDFYETGYFRTPEAIIQNDILPNVIEIIKPNEVTSNFINNRELYNKKLEQKLYELTLSNVQFKNIYTMIKFLEENKIIKKIALHDDSFGLLQSYIVNDTSEFFTVELE